MHRSRLSTARGSPPTFSFTSDGSAACVPACGALLLLSAAGCRVGAMQLTTANCARPIAASTELKGVSISPFC